MTVCSPSSRATSYELLAALLVLELRARNFELLSLPELPALNFELLRCRYAAPSAASFDLLTSAAVLDPSCVSSSRATSSEFLASTVPLRGTVRPVFGYFGRGGAAVAAVAAAVGETVAVTVRGVIVVVTSTASTG